MDYTNDEILRLLKHGRSEEALSYINALSKENFPEDFSIFMDQMLAEYKVSRKAVALRSGLSQDYTYKLLRGAKKTTERDYILAICIAVGMNISQTQHALNIYGMQPLNRNDFRSNIIYQAIQHHRDIDGVNDWLEKFHFPYIKTSPDMPSAPIEIRSDSSIFDEKGLDVGSLPQHVLDGDSRSLKYGYGNENTSEGISGAPKHTYKEIDREVEADHIGNGPMDYGYWGRITVQDEAGRKFYVEASFTMEGDSFFVLDEANHERSQQCPHEWEEELKYMELYDTLADCRNSDFFKYFLILDQITDDKVVENISSIDDTRNYGIRIGAGFVGANRICYLEAFNSQEPAKREYLQIVQKNEEITYSASHESYFMRMELGELYPLYYGQKREPEYYLSVTDTAEIGGRDIGLRFLLDDLCLYMHQYLADQFKGLFDFDDEKITHERILTLIQRSTWFMQQDNDQEALNLLLESAELMEAEAAQGRDYYITLIITYSKIAQMHGNIGDIDSLFDYYEKIYQSKEELMSYAESEDPLSFEQAVWSVGESMLHKAQRIENAYGPYDPMIKEVLEEAIELLEGRCSLEGTWTTLFQAYLKYAFAIDGENPEASAQYSRKALQIVNLFHLDQNPMTRSLVVTLYNNYAWVLWNKLESEEAIIYYGRAIELLESFFYLEEEDEDEIRMRLQHEGKALYNLYLATNKEKESDRLKQRLLENGVEI